MAARLEPEQVQLLEEMIEAERDVPREQRRWYHIGLDQADYLQGPGGKREVVYSDLEELALRGLIRISNGDCVVTAEGRAFYAEMKRQAGEPTENVETEVHRYLDSESFRAAYPGAYERWSEAERELWGDSENALTTIGHMAREAMQRFASEAVQRYKPEVVDPDITKVNRRLGAVIAKALPDLPDARAEVLMALGNYSEAAVDLVQRQEHGEQKQGNPLEWTDGRRVVLTVAVTMFEIATALEQTQPPQT